MYGFKFYIIVYNYVLIKFLENLNDSKFFVVKNINFDVNMEILYICLYSYKRNEVYNYIFFFVVFVSFEWFYDAS